MWRPSDETQACSGRTALIEWLRATGRWPEAAPDGLEEWLAARPIGRDPQLDRLRPLAGITPKAVDEP
jgi:hypothetical protein